MFALSSTSMTSSSSRTIHINTLTKCAKYSNGSDFTNFTPNLKSVSFTPLSRTGFPTQLKSKWVGIGQERTSGVNVKERLSKRAVVKEKRLGKVSLQQRR